MNRDLLMKNVIAKRLSPDEEALITEYVNKINTAPTDPRDQYRPSHLANIAGEFFEYPEMMISRAEEEADLENMPMQMGMAGMGSINKVGKGLISMMTPEAKVLRDRIAKMNRIEKAGEESGKLIKVEGGGLDDIRSAQRDLKASLQDQEVSKNILDSGKLSNFSFDDYIRSKTDLPVAPWGHGKEVYPTQYKQYQKFMKDAASEGMINKSSYSAQRNAPEAVKEANRIHSKNRRELDKIYDFAQAAAREGDIESYNYYKGIVNQLVKNTKPRNPWEYRLDDISVGAEIIPFRNGK